MMHVDKDTLLTIANINLSLRVKSQFGIELISKANNVYVETKMESGVLLLTK